MCPQQNKIEAISQMASPTTIKLLQGFLGIFNYYPRSHPTSEINMQPLACLTSPKVKFKWNQEAHTSFNNIKSLLSHETLLVCTEFDKRFHLDEDASKN